MHIREVPKILFEETSKKYGKGKEGELRYDGRRYQGRELDSEDENIGFTGAIGFMEDGEHTIFVLWPGIPKGLSRGDVSAPHPRLRIVAGPQKAGSWCWGRGQRMQEIAYVDIAYPGTLRLDNLSTRLIAEILSCAHVLATAAEKPRYDEVERYPNRNYTRP